MAFLRRSPTNELYSQPLQPQSTSEPTGLARPEAARTSSMDSPRSRKQFGLFVAGATFFTLSVLVTRRSLVRRYKATVPRFYQPNVNPNIKVNGPMEAFEALNLATLNVLSGMMMVTGGTLWALDVSSMEDLRVKIRGGLGVDGTGRSEQSAEEEMEEWLATVLARKEEKERQRKGKREEPRTNDRGAPR